MHVSNFRTFLFKIIALHNDKIDFSEHSLNKLNFSFCALLRTNVRKVNLRMVSFYIIWALHLSYLAQPYSFFHCGVIEANPESKCTVTKALLLKICFSKVFLLIFFWKFRFYICISQVISLIYYAYGKRHTLTSPYRKMRTIRSHGWTINIAWWF